MAAGAEPRQCSLNVAVAQVAARRPGRLTTDHNDEFGDRGVVGAAPVHRLSHSLMERVMRKNVPPKSRERKDMRAATVWHKLIGSAAHA